MEPKEDLRMTLCAISRCPAGRRTPCIWFLALAHVFFTAHALSNNVPFFPNRHLSSGTPSGYRQNFDRHLSAHNGDNHEKLPPEQDSEGESLDLSSQILLESCLIPDPSCKVRRMSSTDLAYIGDVVYELLVRSRFVWPSRRTKDLQNTVVALVRGKK